MKQVNALARKEGINADTFKSSYLYPAGRFHIGISEAYYRRTKYSIPPEDGKVRKLKPAYNWLKLGDKLLHPKADALNGRPIPYHWVYTAT